MPGIDTSINTTSGLCSSASRMAAAPSLASADHLDAFALERAPNPLAQHRVVIDEDYRESQRCLLSSERRCT